MIYLRWLITYPISILATLIAWLLSPILAMCVRQEIRHDIVKRFGKTYHSFDRYYLWKCLNWFQTHDNACDEYFWGMYGDSDKVTIEQYDNSILLRYWYRLAWLCRNPAYGFSHTVLGFARNANAVFKTKTWKDFEIRTWTNLDGKKAFSVKGKLFITKQHYLDINIGWKSHKRFTRLMFADRLLSFPKKLKI